MAAGFDEVKVDNCGLSRNVTRWAELFNSTGKPVRIENCHNSVPDPQRPEDCPMHMYRSGGDIGASFDSILGEAPACRSRGRRVLQLSGIRQLRAGASCYRPPARRPHAPPLPTRAPPPARGPSVRPCCRARPSPPVVYRRPCGDQLAHPCPLGACVPIAGMEVEEDQGESEEREMRRC